MTLFVRGERTREGPLTLGQLNVFQWVSDTPGSVNTVVSGAFDVPAGTRLRDVVQVLEILLARHEGLRTTYLGGKFPVQRVLGTASLPVPVVGGQDPRRRAEVGAWLCRRVQAEAPALPTDGVPLRVAVATSRDDPDAVVAAAFACTHLALDERAAAILQAEFAEMIADPAARRHSGHCQQPLDQAEAERSPAALRRAEAAMRYWTRMMPLLPQCLYATPRRPGGPGTSTEVRMTSTAAAAALHHIAARARVTRSSIVLAAVCAVLARRTGYRRLVFNTVSANRFEPRLADYVGSLAQGCVAALEVGDADFDTLVRRAWAGAVQAASNAVFDASMRATLGQGVDHDRGVRISYDPVFNSTVIESRPARPDVKVPPLRSLPTALTKTTYDVAEMPPTANPLRFDLYHLDGAVVLQAWSGDTARVPVEELRALLAAVERLLVAAAAADLDHHAIVQAIDLAPIPRGPGWLLVDSCWIELGEVQRLVDDALGADARARVFADFEGQPLVAYLAATDELRSPQQAHARCVAALPGRVTAMTPRRYVLCRTAPADPFDPSTWREVVTAGSGRASSPVPPPSVVR